MAHPLIADDATLRAACAQMAQQPELAVDFEGEWNCHHYGTHLALVQVGDRDRVWLIDALAPLDLSPLWDLLEDPRLLKVMHDPQSDFLLLDRVAQRHPRRIFDTAKAGQLLGRERLGLGGMLTDYCGAVKEEGCQSDDWMVRPLAARMLEYAACDVQHLLRLKDLLQDELAAKERLAWHTEECARLEQIRYVADPEPHLRLKGAKKLNLMAQEILRCLHAQREELARELDRPPYQVIANLQLLQYAQKPPLTAGDWRKLRGVHPWVKRHAEQFAAAVRTGTEAGQARRLCPPAPEERAPRPVSQGEAVRRDKLLQEVQQALQARLPDVHLLVLSNGTRKHLAHGEEIELRDWQRAEIRAAAATAGLDLTGIIP